MKIVARLLVWIVVLSTFRYCLASVSAQKIDKAAFYAAMQSGSKDDIAKELSVLTDSEQGYAGALIIRKAGLPKAKDRLKLFKEGRGKLEAALANDPDNIELHFLRLTIQEHSPKIVKYYHNIEEDKAFVLKHFDKLSPVVQRAIKDYSKDSKMLKPADF